MGDDLIDMLVAAGLFHASFQVNVDLEREEAQCHCCEKRVNVIARDGLRVQEFRHADGCPVKRLRKRAADELDPGELASQLSDLQQELTRLDRHYTDAVQRIAKKDEELRAQNCELMKYRVEEKT